MKKVRAKFSCNKVSNFPNGYKEAELNAVHSESGENADFANATPSGSLTISISPDVPANNYFTPGKDYYLDFTEVE